MFFHRAAASTSSTPCSGVWHSSPEIDVFSGTAACQKKVRLSRRIRFHSTIHRCLLYSAHGRRSMRIAIVLCALSIGYCLVARAADSGLLYSFEQEQELRSIRAIHARASRLKHFVTDGHYALQVDFEATEQPQVEFTADATRTDWRPFGAIAVDATNPSDEPLGFSMEVEDATGTRTAGHTTYALRPHESES